MVSNARFRLQDVFGCDAKLVSLLDEHVTVQTICRRIHHIKKVFSQFIVIQGLKTVSDQRLTGGALVSTEVMKSLGACRGGSFPRKSSCKTLVANDDNYALAA